jgi:drug/metabolite transporter (DMT)-like permease
VSRGLSTIDASRGGSGLVRAALMMVGASAIIAVTSLLAKALGRGVEGTPLHPFQVTAGRFGFALIVLLAISLWLRPRLAGAAWTVHLGRSVCGWAGATCLIAAAAAMPLAEATAISFLSPLAAMVLAIPLLGERVGPIRWSAATVAMVGALVLIRPGTAAYQPAALIALAAAAFMGLEVILIKRLTDREPPLRILLINNSMGAAIAITTAAFVWIAPSPTQWVMMAVLGVSMLGAQILLIQAMRAADASYVMPFFYTTLVFAAVYDVALFGEWPDFLSQLGIVIIVTGAMLLAWRERRLRAATEKPPAPARR